MRRRAVFGLAASILVAGTTLAVRPQAAAPEYNSREAAPLRWRTDRMRLQVFFDRSVIEAFANDGETVLTERVYPTTPFTRVEWMGGEGMGSATARIWPMRSVWQVAR